MFWGSIPEDKQQALIDLAMEFSIGAGDTLKHKYEDILDDITLAWFQSFCIQHAIISKGTLVSLPTGTGKTMTAIAYIKALMQDYIPVAKSIFLCIPSSTEQIYEDFVTYSDLRILKTTGEGEAIQNLIRTPIMFIDTYVVSYKALESIDFCNWAAEHKDFFNIIIVDEAHELSNDSFRKSACQHLMNYCEYKMQLTATPLTVSPLQPLELINMMDNDTIESPSRFLKKFEKRDPNTFEIVGYEGLEDISNLLFPHYVSWTRKELGIEADIVPRLFLVEATDEQKQVGRVEGYKVIKMQRDSNQYKVLRAILQDKQKRGLTGLVFAENKAVCNLIDEVLKGDNVSCEIANGTNTKKQRREILTRFKNKDTTCLVTNLTTALNMPCDYIVVFQQTTNLGQLLGRPVRGFTPGRLELDYIITEDTVEIDQFYENVYKRQEYLRDMLGKDADVAERFKKAIDKRKQLN